MTHGFATRWIGPDDIDRERALAMALNLSAARALDSPTKVAVESFLASCHACGASTDLLIGGYRGSRLVGAAVVAGAIKSRAGVTFLSATHDPVSCEHGTHIMQAVVLHAERFGFRLLQHLCAPEDDDRACVLSESGYRYLTRLIYLRRDCGGDVYPASMLNDVDWVTYSAKTDALFRAALEATYVDSLDCPELTGLRDTEEVMASHRSTGRFDASLWWLALRGDVPVGVLLLSRIESTQALEVVYVGVAHDARGSGVSDALMEKALTCVQQQGAACLTLAVDHRNAPARRMYARWGLQERLARDAWITTSQGTPVW